MTKTAITVSEWIKMNRLPSTEEEIQEWRLRLEAHFQREQWLERYRYLKRLSQSPVFRFFRWANL